MNLTSQILGNHPVELKQINVILGANGVGKSRLLDQAKSQTSQICPGKKVVYVEGGRAITLQDTLRLTNQNFRQYQDYDRAKNTYEGKRQQKLSDRVYDALMMLEKKELAIKAAHSDAVESWLVTDQEGMCPKRETPPLERLFALFHEIFPKLRVNYDPNSKLIQATKGEHTYAISSMSDGEKQCFSILADFVELNDEYRLVIVDEPELNLHPELSERIWSLIECEFPDKVYLYATHSLSFAMRSSVEKVIVLSETPNNIAVIDNRTDFSQVDIRQFLGSIPGILSANRVVVTEGDEKSFDSVFYRWILQDDQVEVLPARDCTQVKNVVARSGVWDKISTNIKLAGVIDRDFCVSAEPEVVVLNFREAESYLALPCLAVETDKHLSLREQRLTEDEVINLIMECLKQEEFHLIGCSVSANCGIRISVSVRRGELRNCKHLDELKALLKRSSEEEIDKAQRAVGEETVNQRVDEMSKHIYDIVGSRDWNMALQLIDGKNIACRVAKMIGIRNAIDMMRCVKENVNCDIHESVSSLQHNILSRIT